MKEDLEFFENVVVAVVLSIATVLLVKLIQEIISVI